MSSTNEELSPQPKPRASPLDFRNTDLVSRLLAATPPYLYNMPMVPNSYFFSEMLRSFVQAKSEHSSRAPGSIHQRRPRKRSWTQARADYYHRESPKSPKPDINLNDWSSKPVSPEALVFDNKRSERPLELTMGKMPLNSNTKVGETDTQRDTKMPMTTANSHYPTDKQELPTINQSGHIPMMFPTIPQSLNQEPTHPNLMLPPPPPIWYPPLYPPPYGFDPLHFFIDLRVSGHIYDRKNGKDNINNTTLSNSTVSIPHTETNSQQEDVSIADTRLQNLDTGAEGFKQSRHRSAFSVPIPAATRNIPINLSSNKLLSGEYEARENRSLKFDVKSMGFEKASNKTSTNYVMGNIGKIYRDLSSCKMEPAEQKYESSTSPEAAKESADENREETEEEKEKRMKDLRALIGLELVVDYMNHAKPRQVNRGHNSEESSTDVESADSPVEVVASGEEL